MQKKSLFVGEFEWVKSHLDDADSESDPGGGVNRSCCMVNPCLLVSLAIQSTRGYTRAVWLC